MFLFFCVTCGLTALTYGWKNAFKAMRSISVLWKELEPSQIEIKDLDILKRAIFYGYVCGALGLIYGILYTMGHSGGEKPWGRISFFIN